MLEFLLITHFLFVFFVFSGFLLYLGYPFFRWEMVRNTDFRVLHAMSIVFVALESVLGIPCPLTLAEWAVSEGDMRRSFVSRLFFNLMYYRIDESVFTAAYVILAATALGTWLFIPVSKPFRSTLSFRVLRNPFFWPAVAVGTFFWLKGAGLF